jgi:hypothetical protein
VLDGRDSTGFESTGKSVSLKKQSIEDKSAYLPKPSRNGKQRRLGGRDALSR